MDLLALCMCLVTIFILYVKADKEMSTQDIACKQLTPSACPGHLTWASACLSKLREKGVRTCSNRIRFKLYKELKTWDEALKICQAKGGTLAMPKTKKKQSALQRICRDNTFLDLELWIGLADVDGNNIYRSWVDGQKLTYTNWRQGEPNAGGERCVTNVASFTRNDGWHDLGCEQKRGFMCQLCQ